GCPVFRKWITAKIYDLPNRSGTLSNVECLTLSSIFIKNQTPCAHSPQIRRNRRKTRSDFAFSWNFVAKRAWSFYKKSLFIKTRARLYGVPYACKGEMNGPRYR